MEQKQVSSQIAANMGRFLTRYGDYITNVSKIQGTPQQRQVLYYLYLSSLLELFRRDIANFFTSKQRDTLLQKNDEYLRLCLSMPGLKKEEEVSARQSHASIQKILSTPLTQKDDYKSVYKLDDAQMKKLRAQSDQFYGDVLAVMDANIANIRRKKYGQTMYIATKRSLLPNIFTRVFGRKTTQDSTFSNLKHWESTANDEFVLIADLLFNKKNTVAAAEHYNKLKIMLNKLARKNVSYSLAGDFERMGNILTALKTGRPDLAVLLKKKNPFRYNGKLTFTPPTPMEEKLMAALAQMGATRQNNRVFQEVRQVVKARDEPFINFILTGEGQLDNYKDKPQKYIIGIISKHLRGTNPLQGAANAKQQEADRLLQAATAATTPKRQTKLTQDAANAKQQQAKILLQAAASTTTPGQQTKLLQSALTAARQSKQLQQTAQATKRARRVISKINKSIITQDTSGNEQKKKTYNNIIKKVLIEEGVDPATAKQLSQDHPHDVEQFEKVLASKLLQTTTA